MSPPAEDEYARCAADLVANTNVTGFEATFSVVRIVNPSDVDTVLAVTLDTENLEELAEVEDCDDP
jgi:hypothetical protein